MTCAEILTIIILIITCVAIYRSPIEAVKVGQRLQEEQKNRDAKERLFLNLMAYRRNQLHQNFVTALNTIDIVFHDVPKVLQSWNLYFENLKKKATKENAEEFDKERQTLLSNLFSEIGGFLGYTVKQEGYNPQLYEDNFYRDIELQNLWIEYLKKAVPLFEESIEFYQRLKNQPPPNTDDKKD